MSDTAHKHTHSHDHSQTFCAMSDMFRFHLLIQPNIQSDLSAFCTMCRAFKNNRCFRHLLKSEKRLTSANLNQKYFNKEIVLSDALIFCRE